MPLTDTASVMLALSVQAGDPFTVNRYDTLRKQAERAVINYCKWPIIGMAGETRYYDGNNYPDLILRPFTSNVASVYLDNTGNYGNNPGSFPSSSLLTFGQDYSLVEEGSDGSARPYGNVGLSGLLRRISNQSQFWFPSDLVWYRSSGGLAYRKGATWPKGYGNIKVTSDWGFSSGVAISGATWSSGTATFTTATPHILWTGEYITIAGVTPAGFNLSEPTQVSGVISATQFTVPIATNPGSSYSSGGTIDAVPWDIKAAVAEAVGIMRNTLKYGGPLTSESAGDYSYSVAIQREMLFGSVRQLLSGYRNVPLAGVA